MNNMQQQRNNKQQRNSSSTLCKNGAKCRRHKQHPHEKVVKKHSNHGRPQVDDADLAAWIDFGILRGSMAEEGLAVVGLAALFSTGDGGVGATICGFLPVRVLCRVTLVNITAKGWADDACTGKLSSLGCTGPVKPSLPRCLQIATEAHIQTHCQILVARALCCSVEDSLALQTESLESEIRVLVRKCMLPTEEITSLMSRIQTDRNRFRTALVGIAREHSRDASYTRRHHSWQCIERLMVDGVLSVGTVELVAQDLGLENSCSFCEVCRTLIGPLGCGPCGTLSKEDAKHFMANQLRIRNTVEGFKFQSN